MKGGVKVAVRVRPFNDREKKKKAKLCIEMDDYSTIIIDEEGKEKTFTFDHSFWSHDDFETDENGIFVPTSQKYADQRKVYECLGVEILQNAWDGYNCCLFAYGQTGSGKSYSMVGYNENKGIVPISCEEIFKRIGENTDENKSYEVEISMFEIYNEKLHDLLIPVDKRPPSGLKIRENKTLGVFVEGLTKYPVMSYEQIEKKTNEGYRHRTINATEMNKNSSRAHTIVTIEFKQVSKVNKKGKEKKSVKSSIINLVDLAGSERASNNEDALIFKEGCNINKSLTSLGMVINALAEKPKNRGLVPYRDSVLTRILQNALGGNSRTVMICALSPASVNYEETLGTLRYAERAKRIENKAVINEDPSVCC